MAPRMGVPRARNVNVEELAQECGKDKECAIVHEEGSEKALPVGHQSPPRAVPKVSRCSKFAICRSHEDSRLKQQCQNHQALACRSNLPCFASHIQRVSPRGRSNRKEKKKKKSYPLTSCSLSAICVKPQDPAHAKRCHSVQIWLKNPPCRS